MIKILIILMWASVCGAEVDSTLAPALAAEQNNSTQERFQVGHNLSVTSDILPTGSCTVGGDVLACGVADRWTIGSSPWMYLDYNMYSLAVRGLISEDAKNNRWAIQVSYFKTYKNRQPIYDDFGQPYGYRNYQMNALWLMLVRTINYAPHYRLHINLHANQYFDETMPFSLRRPSQNRSPYQFNATLLHEVDLVNSWFILGEVGLLDFARSPFLVHTGVSIGRWFGSLSFHVGYTMTGTIESWFRPVGRADYQQKIFSEGQFGYKQELDSDLIRRDFSIHPEFSLRYDF